MSKLFTRRKEDFICDECGYLVHGNGYTNHCPKCLCSKHVDINPGDRESECCGIMRPIAIEMKRGKYILVHKCKKCGFIRKNKLAPEDDFTVVLKITQNPMD